MTAKANIAAGENPEQFEIRLAKSKRERLEIYQFRFKVLAEEIGLTGNDINEKAKSVFDEHDQNSQQVFITRERAIAAAVRLFSASDEIPRDFSKNFALRPFAEFGARALSFTGRLTVARRWRGAKVTALLASAVFKLALKGGALFDFANCAPELVVLYERLGYRRFTDNYSHPDLGLQVPLVLVLHDLAHLQHCKSPFADFVRAIERDRESVQWFARHYPGTGGANAAKADDEQNFWNYLTEQLHQNPLHGVPLFEGMSFREAQQFLRSSSVIQLKAGAPLTRAGDHGREMFVVLSGALNVTQPGSNATLARVGRGALLGELAFLSESPRSANITVVDEAEVLVLSQEVFKNVVEKIPQVAAKVLFNLSLILCERLKTTSALVAADGGGA